MTPESLVTDLVPELKSWGPILLALIAISISLRNRETAMRALSLSEAQEDRRLLGLKYVLEESISIGGLDGDIRWISIRLLVRNPAEKASSIAAARLRVGYEMADRTLVASIAPDSSGAPELLSGAVWSVPVGVAANEALSGWITFPIPHGMIGGPITSFAVTLEDTHGAEATIDVWPLRTLEEKP